MVTNVQELKDLIIWLKANRVKSLKIGDVAVEMSDYAHIESLSEAPAEQVSKTSAKQNELDEQLVSGDISDDDLANLFHSSRS